MIEISRRKLLAAGAAGAAAAGAAEALPTRPWIRYQAERATANARARWRADLIRETYRMVWVAPDWNAKEMFEAFIGPDGIPTHGAACVTYPGDPGRRMAFVAIDTQDPNSITMLRTFKKLSHLIDFHIFPLAFLGPVSEFQGATILGAPNRALAMDDQITLFSQKGSNGIEYDVSRISEDSERKIWANTNLFRATRGVDVPFGVYLGMDGGYRPFNNQPDWDHYLALFDLVKAK